MRGELGIFTTIPVELALAGGWRPVDLNNRFVAADDPGALVESAEAQGLPASLCSWVKGMFAWLMDHPEMETVVGVGQGDCSNNHALMELLTDLGRRVVSFAYPAGRDSGLMARELESLASALGASLADGEAWRQRLMPLRRELAALDELTWREGKVSGQENYFWLLEASDFNGDPEAYAVGLSGFLAQARQRPAASPRIRLGLVGVPTIITGLHQAVEELGAAVVYNEIPRQFAMTSALAADSLAEQYLAYTYPYDIFARVDDIAAQARLRGLDGLIHYTQAFCHRRLHASVLRRRLELPMLTLEADRPGPLDGRTLTRLEAFVEMLGRES